MKKSGNIVGYTSEELAKMRAKGLSKSDWARANAMTQEEIEAAIASDPDEAGIVWDKSIFYTSHPPPPSTKVAISLRIDPDILEFFRQGGSRYQTRINGVLRMYMDAQKREAERASKEEASQPTPKLRKAG